MSLTIAKLLSFDTRTNDLILPLASAKQILLEAKQTARQVSQLFDLKKIHIPSFVDFISDSRSVYFVLSVNCLCARVPGKRSINMEVIRLFFSPVLKEITR